MEGKKKSLNGNYLRSLVLLIVLVFTAAGIASAEEASGTVSIETKSVAIGIGFSWGDGVLHFQGKDYPFRITRALGR